MEKKKLDLLRVRYTDAYPDVEAAQERIAETEQKLAAMPAVRPAPDAEQARLGAVTKQMNRLGAEKVRLSASFQRMQSWKRLFAVRKSMCRRPGRSKL